MNAENVVLGTRQLWIGTNITAKVDNPNFIEVLSHFLAEAVESPRFNETAIGNKRQHTLIAQGAREVTEADISGALYTAGVPDPDLVIRTSGEMRVSNFLLWQIAYAELYVTPVLWPDFRKAHLVAAIAEYQAALFFCFGYWCGG